MERCYLEFDPLKGYPVGKDIYYECAICGDVIPSMPNDGLGCSCRNIFIDVDAGRVSVKDCKKIWPFKR